MRSEDAIRADVLIHQNTDVDYSDYENSAHRLAADVPILLAELASASRDVHTLLAERDAYRSLTAERDRARSVAVTLEQENARLSGAYSASRQVGADLRRERDALRAAVDAAEKIIDSSERYGTMTWLLADLRRALGVPATTPAPERDEQRFREILAANPHFGDWDEWAKIAYDKIPVLPRTLLSHVYGRHDDSLPPFAHCVLCMYFRPAGATTPPEEQRR